MKQLKERITMNHKTRFGYLLLLGLALAITLFAGPAAAEDLNGADPGNAEEGDFISTRFGDLSVNKDEFLLFKEIPVKPEVWGGLSFVDKFIIGDADVVLVARNSGGNTCPMKYYFVTVKSKGISKITDFRTCSESIDLKYKKSGSSIIVTLPDFGSAKKKAKFVYKNGVVTKNGKVIKDLEDPPPSKFATKDEALDDFLHGDRGDVYLTKHGELTLLNEEGKRTRVRAVEVKLNGKTILSSAGKKDGRGYELTLMVDEQFSSPKVPTPYQKSKDSKIGHFKVDRIIISEFGEVDCVVQLILLDFTGDKPFLSERFGYNPDLKSCVNLRRIKWGKKKSYFYTDNPLTFIYYTGSRVELADE